MDKRQRKSFFELISVVQLSTLCSSQVDNNSPLDLVQLIYHSGGSHEFQFFIAELKLMVSLCFMKAPSRGSEKYPRMHTSW